MVIIIPIDGNGNLANEIMKDSELYIKSAIRSVAFGNEIVKNISKEKIVINNKGEIVHTIIPWEGMPTGTFTIETQIVDNNDKSLSNIIKARWFRANRVSRVVNIKSNTNFYQEGDYLDLSVIGTFFHFNEGDEFLITAAVAVDGKKYKFSKEHKFNKEESEEITFDFSDQKISYSGKVQSIQVKIEDKKTGEIKDEQILTLNQDKIYVNGKSEGINVVEKFSALSLFQKLLTIFVIGLPVIVVIVLIFKKRRNMSVGVLVLTLGVSVLFLGTQVEAVCEAPTTPEPPCTTPTDPASGGKIFLKYGDNGEYSIGDLGTSPCTIEVKDIFAHLECSTCLNGTRGNFGIEVQKINGTPVGSKCVYIPDQGHKWHYKDPSKPLYWVPPGPYNFAYDLPGPGDYQYRLVANSSPGCKCALDTWNNDWVDVVCEEKIGECGPGWSNDSNNPTIVESEPNTDLCADGSTPSIEYNANQTWNWRWLCQGDVADTCYAKQKRDCEAVTECGTDHLAYHINKPTDPNLCKNDSVLVGSVSNLNAEDKWTWKCSNSSECVGEASCYAPILRKNGACYANPVHPKIDYLYTTIGPDSDKLCLVGNANPLEPLFTGYGSTGAAIWSCLAINGNAIYKDADCYAERQLPVSSCKKPPHESKNINTTPSGALCEDGNTASVVEPQNSNISGWDGKWTWTCLHDWFVGQSQYVDKKVDCYAESCLSEDVLQVQSNVYLKESIDEQQATVQVVCSGRDVCCKFEDAEVGGIPSTTTICSGDTNAYIKIDSSRGYPADCY